MQNFFDKTLSLLFLLMVAQMLLFAIYLRIHKLSAAGKPPINALVFKLAKLAMFFCWALVFVKATGIYNFNLLWNNNVTNALALLFFVSGYIIQAIAYFNLGKNLKFGIPNTNEQQNAALKSNGLYRLSRNPMYLGFFLLTITAVIYVAVPCVFILAAFTLLVHHKIVLAEELFLKTRFGNEWDVYSKKTKRYL